MLINSYEFAIYFSVVFILHWSLPHRWRTAFLLGASYWFYGQWEPRFLLLICLATAVDFCIAQLLDQRQIPSRLRKQVGLYVAVMAIAALLWRWDGGSLSHPFTAGQFLLYLEPQRWLGVAGCGLGGWLLAEGLHGWFSRSLNQDAALASAHQSGSDNGAGASRDRQRKLLLWLSLCTNLGILGCFKYFNFFVDSLEGLLTGLGFQADLFSLSLLLPIGISFYSFKTMAYVIDVYRGKQSAETSLVRYGLFLAFFPAMLAGPIDRAKHLLPQFQTRRYLTLSHLGQGLVLILLGLLKKVAIADGIAPSVSAIYQGSGAVSSLDVAAATVLYAVQIYGDFSGYTDMARGVAKLLGFDLTLNFKLPYFSQNPSEFWQRWHISLSTWLRDYLYIPLGGNRNGAKRTYFNLMLTMILGGLWHGATWNFGLWGAYQGAILCIHRAWSLTRPQSPASPQSSRAEVRGKAKTDPGLSWAALWRIPLFFVVTCYGWLLFGVTSFERIAQLTLQLFSFNFNLGLPQPPLASLLGILLLFGYEAIEYLSQQQELYRRVGPALQGFFYAALVFVVLMGSSNAPAQFIYTQF